MPDNKEKIYAFAGSFNPPHIGHMISVRDMLNRGAERIHIFVRVNEKLDLVDKETKEKWFLQMKQDYIECGWDKVIIHMVESKKVTGKKYSLQVIRNGIKQLDEYAGEHITHYYAGDDYKKIKLIWRFIIKDTKLVIAPRNRFCSSTLIREDLEANRYLLPSFIYEDLKKLKEKQNQIAIHEEGGVSLETTV